MKHQNLEEKNQKIESSQSTLKRPGAVLSEKLHTFGYLKETRKIQAKQQSHGSESEIGRHR